jgi:hypothetical protein
MFGKIWSTGKYRNKPQTDPPRSMSKQGKHTLIKLVKHDRRRSVLYDVEIAYDSSFDYNVIVICIWLCTSKVIWNLDFLEVFFKTWIGIADLFYIGNVTQKIWSFSTLYIIPNILFTVQKSAILVVSHFYSIIFHKK